MQCLYTGPDSLTIKIPRAKALASSQCFQRLSSLDVGHPDYFKINSNSRTLQTKRKLQLLPQLHPDIHNWMRLRKKISSPQRSLVLVLTSKDNSSVNPDDCCIVQDRHKGKYLLPFLKNAMDKSSKIAKFHCISEEDYKQLVIASKDGVETGADGTLFDDFISKKCPSQYEELLCVDDVIPQFDDNYHGASRVYAGGASNRMIDDSFKCIKLPNNKNAHYKLCMSSDYVHHVLLSMGFFDSNFHGIKLSKHHVRLFVGKNNTL